MKFEWDEAKDASNLRKHGVSFHEAVDVFDDPFCLTEAEGMENGEDIIRIISARYATRKERRDYGNKNG